MDFFYSFLICIAMYSIIPVPLTEWTKQKMRYCFCFFPCIGGLIGGVGYVLSPLLARCTPNFAAIIFLLLPPVFSGGIHLDGLIDSCDAFFSFGDRQKKLDILKDPRTGAFGVIGAVVYFLLLFATYSQLLASPALIFLLPFVFILSRTVGALCMLCVKNARSNGLGATFSNASDKITLVALCLWLLGTFTFLFVLHAVTAMLFAAVIGLFLLWYLPYIHKEFGGITGDLTGFVISTLELLLPLTLALGGLFL